MLSKTVEDALNEQINKELYSSYLYLSMSAYCDSVNLPGSAHWMRAQSQEELSHGMKLFGFVNDRGGRVILDAIEKPPAEFKSLLDVFEKVLEHEKKVTGMINKLYEVSLKENDYATQNHLQWFVDEQVEEEKSAGDIVERLRMIGDHSAALFMLDSHLAQRGSGG